MKIRPSVVTELFVVLPLAVYVLYAVNAFAGCVAGLPAGTWSVAASPFTGPGYKTMPLIVSKVQLDVSCTVSQLEVQNISPKAVTSFRLAWGLASETDPGVVLGQGQSGVLAASSPIPSKYACPITYSTRPFLSFATDSAALAENGQVTGDYVYTVVVSQVTFADGTTWTAQAPNGNAAIPNIIIDSGFCDGERCRRLSSPIGGIYFTCSPASGKVCSPSGASCITNPCDRMLPPPIFPGGVEGGS